MLHFFFSSSETAVNNLTVGRESATPCTYWIVRHFSLALHFLVAFGNKAVDVAQWLLFIYLFIYQACLLSLCKWPLCRSRRQSPSLGVSWLVTSVTDKKIWWQCSRKSSYAGNLLLEYWYFQNDIPLYIYGALSGKQGDSSRNVCMTNKLWRHESCKEFIVLLETAGGDMQ